MYTVRSCERLLLVGGSNYSGLTEQLIDGKVSSERQQENGGHPMPRIPIMVATALIAVVGTAAIAQTKPGGNVPPNQGPCARGYEASAPNGRMQLSSEQMKSIDLNNDGNISKSEFDAACGKGLFEEGKKG